MAKTHQFLLWKVIFHRFKRKFIKNPIDAQVENFLLSLTSTTELKQILSNKDLKEIYSFVSGKVYELARFYHLYTQIIIPNHLAYIKKMNRHSKKSFYEGILGIDRNFDREIFEVTRIGYVHLYHKYESYIKELCQVLDKYLVEAMGEQIAIIDFLKTEMKGYNLFYLNFQPPSLKKINWICNCVKHYDGFPLKKNPPEQYANLTPAAQLEIGPEEFGNDIIFMLDYFAEVFTICLYTGYIEYGLKKARSSSQVSAEVLQSTEAQLKAALFMRLFALTGKMGE